MGLPLFCLPYAGASAMVYARWRRLAPPSLEVVPVELPGRGARSREALRTDLFALAQQLAGEIAAQIAARTAKQAAIHAETQAATQTASPARAGYALFGHSLGGLLALEVAHALQARGGPAPRGLIVSGTQAPALRDDSRYRHPYSDAELMDSLRRLNGTPPEVLADAEMMAMTLPVLRADFLLCGSYQARQRAPLHCPLHVLAGSRDGTAPPHPQAWAAETSSTCSSDVFDGDHFFIHSHEPDVIRQIVLRLGLAASVADNVTTNVAANVAANA